MDLPRERGERDAVSHGERELHDQLPRPAAYDRRAEDAAVGARDDLREPDGRAVHDRPVELAEARAERRHPLPAGDRKSTRLNSSHGYISYAVFCLKKKKNKSR